MIYVIEGRVVHLEPATKLGTYGVRPDEADRVCASIRGAPLEAHVYNAQLHDAPSVGRIEHAWVNHADGWVWARASIRDAETILRGPKGFIVSYSVRMGRGGGRVGDLSDFRVFLSDEPGCTGTRPVRVVYPRSRM